MTEVEQEFLSLARRLGHQRAIELIGRATSGSESETLTIIANAGMHRVPVEFVEGELFIASDSSHVFTNAESVEAIIAEMAERLAGKLRERRWTKVIIIPFGHAVVSMAIKLVVYRVTRISSHELFFFSDGHYELISPFERSLLAS